MPFEFTSPDTIEEALQVYSDGARWFAGGTDIIPEFKAGLANPKRLVNLKRIGALHGIRIAEDGLHLGALATLGEISSDAQVRQAYRALAQACELSASPQIRNVATIGGNLCQDSRCPYYRGEFYCYLKGGKSCYMLKGENRNASVIGYDVCPHTHPSDPASALIAYDAEILVHGPDGERAIPAGGFFTAPHGDERRMNMLEQGQVIREIRLPRLGDGSRSVFLKAMDRAAWAFALVSAAVRLDMSGEQIEVARVVLGGVAPVPWREGRVERVLEGSVLNEETAARASAEALLGAAPLAHNRYKLHLARALVKKALTELCIAPEGRS
jgi:xanthine dehydrogenase YagS FAD-binding subunit